MKRGLAHLSPGKAVKDATYRGSANLLTAAIGPAYPVARDKCPCPRFVLIQSRVSFATTPELTEAA